MPNLRVRLGGWIREGLGEGLAAALPQHCFVCGARSGTWQFCTDCSAALPRVEVPVCPVCADECGGGEVCGQCLLSPPHFDRSTAALRYAFPVREWVQAIKYQARLDLARDAVRCLQAHLAPADFDCIVPVPLHPVRLAERGFNQAAVLAAPLARSCGKPLLRNAVIKDRLVPPQAGLDREARRRNLAGAFRAERRLDGLRVLVVDDVMTTGATLNELALALKAAGAAQVSNLALARAMG
ncbi:ComF family protein [Niveibacterium sp. SC-1]|uniref:ComF family protein n=1 Tax=Niveibacterium sp. SC-1 TaxID=3135646 RepID=UPI00311E76AD